MKLLLAQAINGLIVRQWLNPVTTVNRFGSTKPKVSVLANCKLDGFSNERLTTLLTTLDQDEDIVIRNKPPARSRADRRRRRRQR